jgi:glycosyltransferase involved in cell wall biosynthesis
MHQVIFFEEPVFETRVEPLARIATEPSGVRVVTPVLPDTASPELVLKYQRIMVREILARTPHDRLIAWYYTPMALKFTDDLESDVCVYDCMDELSAFKNAPSELKQLEQNLLARADIVFTGGQSLYEAKRNLHPSVYPFPSSIDSAHFRKARLVTVDPVDQANIPHPRVGYFGVVDERLDVELVAFIAKAMPDVHFVMLGPVVKIEAASLPKSANLHWLGGKSYDELPRYLAHWDAGWMPFALNESTRYISPTKTPEFLAAGLPVISTAIVDVVRTYGAAGLVQIADAEDFEIKLRNMLLPAQPYLPDLADAYLADMSWDKTWSAMSDHIVRTGAMKSTLPLRKGA